MNRRCAVGILGRCKINLPHVLGGQPVGSHLRCRPFREVWFVLVLPSSTARTGQAGSRSQCFWTECGFTSQVPWMILERGRRCTACVEVSAHPVCVGGYNKYALSSRANKKKKKKLQTIRHDVFFCFSRSPCIPPTLIDDSAFVTVFFRR